MSWPALGFTVFILLMLALDLGLLQRRPHVISMKEAMTWFALSLPRFDRRDRRSDRNH